MYRERTRKRKYSRDSRRRIARNMRELQLAAVFRNNSGSDITAGPGRGEAHDPDCREPMPDAETGACATKYGLASNMSCSHVLIYSSLPLSPHAGPRPGKE